MKENKNQKIMDMKDSKLIILSPEKLQLKKLNQIINKPFIIESCQESKMSYIVNRKIKKDFILKVPMMKIFIIL